MARIAVEKPFDDVKMALEEKGHEATMFQSAEKEDMEMVKGYDVGVVRALGDTSSEEFDFPVVSAEGMSVDEIVADVEERLSRLS